MCVYEMSRNGLGAYNGEAGKGKQVVSCRLTLAHPKKI